VLPCGVGHGNVSGIPVIPHGVPLLPAAVPHVLLLLPHRFRSLAEVALRKH